MRMIDLLKQAGISKIALGAVQAAQRQDGQPLPAPASQTQAALPAGGSGRKCGFRPDLEAGNIDQAKDVLLVTVDASGKPVSVHLVSDPNHGFGATATKCALSSRYVPARNGEGELFEGVTQPITVNFVC